MFEFLHYQLESFIFYFKDQSFRVPAPQKVFHFLLFFLVGGYLDFALLNPNQLHLQHLHPSLSHFIIIINF